MYAMATVILLTISNIFMTIAWYGHLRYKHVWLGYVKMFSWISSNLPRKLR